jgi:hypothetical protein
LECVADGDAESSVLVVWDSGAPAPPTVNRAPSEGADSHEDPRRSPLAQQQKSDWLRPQGRFTEVCGTTPCTAPPAT